MIVTGLDDRESVERAFAVGATDYVTKPVHAPVLTQRLRRLLEASRAEESLRQAEAKYRHIFEDAVVGIFQSPVEGGYLAVNPTLAHIYGYTSQEQLMVCLRDIQQLYVNPHRRHEFIQAIEQYGTVANFESQVYRADGKIIWISENARAVKDRDGKLLYYEGMVEDITARKRAEQHLTIEHGTTKILANTLVTEAIPKILQGICESLGWVMGEYWQLERDSLRCRQWWHSSSADFSEFQAVTQQSIFTAGVGLPGRIWATGEAVWIVDIVEDSNFVRASVAAQAGVRTAFGFPILLGQETLGVMTFFSRAVQQPDLDLLMLMEAIGGQIGQFIKRQQLEQELQRQNLILQSELKGAADYVRSLLPDLLDYHLAIEWRFIPSQQLGGDIFDYYWLDEDNLVIYLIDVSGHGIRAALLSVAVLNLLRSQSLYNTDFYEPWTVLAELNRVFQMNEDGSDYFTIWYGVYNHTNRQLVYANAGHPPALLLSAINPSVQLLSAHSAPIGIIPEADFDQAVREIPHNSSLYLFSDGVYEIVQPDGNIWGIKNFTQFIVEHNDSDLDQIIAQIGHLSPHQTFEDDFSLLKISFGAQSA